ncbi:glycosyltransferase [uncultured Psychrobacillus sp.]|uniref:glycosyltransferase family 2 protein n=1 Tax=uncultured Psychrobacillus sp. TaxID=1551585 RepID=UPI00262E07B8|nr:glycosyltransferase [uncultured Psychrobacillus sp.]
MDSQLISAIITTYKRDKKYLKRAILSVLNQTYTNFELIIVDDNGQNEFQYIVEETIKEINPNVHIKVIKHEQNMGAQVARNNGIRSANGKFIAFLDDDDEWIENKLDLQLKKFNTNNKLGLVYCWYNICKNNEKTKKIRKPSKNLRKGIRDLLRTNFIGSTSFPLIKKECFDKVGLFDETLKAKQDYDMWLRICKEYQIDFVEVPLCNYYIHSDERITSNVQNKLESEEIFLKKHINDINKDKKALSFKYRLIGSYYLKLKNIHAGRRCILKSILIYPFSYKTYINYLLSFLKKEHQK